MLSTPVSGGLLFTDSDPFDSSSALEQTRTRTPRTTVFELRDAVARGAIVVDIRPQAQRALQGTLPGALAIERNVLEALGSGVSRDVEEQARQPGVGNVGGDLGSHSACAEYGH